MQKRLFLFLSILTLTLPLGGCRTASKQEAPETSQETEAEPPAPGEETWSTAPSYSASMISSSSIRYLSVTAGASEDQIYLTWYSPSPDAGEALWTTADDEGFQNASSFQAFDTSESAVTSGYYINRVAVTGLSPQTDYLYQVGNEGGGYSPSYRYTTPDFSDTFRFTVIGDPQLGKPVDELDNQKTTFKKVLNKIKYHFPDTSFLVSLGDQVNDYDDTEQYNALLDQAALYSLSFVPVKGNHEQGGPQYSEHYTLPNQSSLGVCDDEGDGDYWFVRGNALFLVLDVIDAQRWGEHKEFITQACADNPDVRWRIVFCHYSPYNSYEAYLENAQDIRPYFLDFTSACGIDLVMTGHDHSYSRTFFIQGDGSYEEYESPAVDPSGTMYVTLSSSSGSLYHTPTAQNEVAVSRRGKAPEVTDVTVSPESLTVTTYVAETWEIVDTFEIQKTVEN